MTHRCNIYGSSAACVEIDGNLWVKEFCNSRENEGRTYMVNFCPECGFKLPRKKTFLEHFSMPDSNADESISKFSMELGKSIAEMNHNIEIMKAFMSSQNCQNSCLIENEMELRRRIIELEKN
jgi:hypothetical protein